MTWRDCANDPSLRQTLKASRCLDHCFQYFILSQRNHLFRHISLDMKAKKPELERAISLLLLFDVKTMSIHEAATSTLLHNIRAVLTTSPTQIGRAHV